MEFVKVGLSPGLFYDLSNQVVEGFSDPLIHSRKQRALVSGLDGLLPKGRF